MFVCHCKAVTDRTIGAAISQGATTVADITSLCRAGGGCGGCHTVLQSLIDACYGDESQASMSAA